MEARINWRSVVQGHLKGPQGQRALKSLLKPRYSNVSAKEMAHDAQFVFNLADIAHAHTTQNASKVQAAPFTMHMLFNSRGSHHHEFSEHFKEAAGRLLSRQIPTTPRRPTVEQIMRMRRGSKH